MRISTVTLQLRHLLLGTTALTGLALALAPAAEAGGLPTGGTVTVGSATIAQTAANKLAVTTGGARTVIDWQSFSIGSGNKVAIQQPGKSSITVNQVTGGTPSQIFGSLWSNGQVVLANPNGIWFGPDSHVNVAGLVASTATMTAQAKQAFAAGGRLALDQAGSATASIVNDGHITIASEGLGAFVAPGVRNNGVIQATLGQVTLAAGTTSTLDFYGDGLVSLAVTSPVTALAIGPDGKPFKAAIENNGTINASGGHVLVTADVVKGMVDNVINMSGVTEAKGAVKTAAGDIVLDGGDGGVMVAGTLDASVAAAGHTGGAVAVTGGTVALAATAVVDASGAAGGGTVQIGGGPHGGGPVKHAKATTVAAGAQIKADATRSGTGGTVAVWSDDTTQFDGLISAKGAGTGNGGWVETSGKNVLGVGPTAHVDTTAPGGAMGNWLLDPFNITVSDSGTDPYNPTIDGSPTDTSNVTIAPSAFQTQTSNVTLSASNNLFVSSPITMTSAGLSLIGNNLLEIDQPITVQGGALSLSSNNVITVNAQLTAVGAVSAQVAEGGTFSLTSSGGISAGGAVSILNNSQNPRTVPVTQLGATITIDAAVSGQGIYIKAADQTLNEPGGVITLGSNANLSNGETGLAAGGSQADIILYAGLSQGSASVGKINIQSGAAISAASGNIALVADNLSIADAPANISTPGGVVLSPAATDGELFGGTGYTDPVTTTALLANGLPSGATLASIGVASGSGTYAVPQSTITSLNGTFPEDGLVHVGLLQVGLLGASNQVNVDTASLPLATNINGGSINFTNNTTVGGSLRLQASTIDITDSLQISGDLTANASSTIDLGGSVNTDGSQSYSGSITLTNTSLLTTTAGLGGNISFDTASSINGTSDLTISADGAVTFQSAIGNATPLNSLSVTGASIALETNTVQTVGDQNFTGPVAVSITPTNFASTSGGITFFGSLDGNVPVTVSGPDHVTFEGAVGGNTQLNTLTVNSNNITLSSVTTDTFQTYNGPVTLSGLVTLSAGDDVVTFGSTVTGAAGTSLEVDGLQAVLAGNVSVGGTQTYNASVLLANDITISGTGPISIGAVDSQGTLQRALTISDPGNTVSLQSVGAAPGLTTLSITGSSISLPANVQTVGNQTYTGPVVLTDNTSFFNNGGAITFTSTVDSTPGNNFNLSVTANAGTAVFGGPVGGSTPVGSFDVTGNSIILTGGVSSTNTQTYNGPVVIAANTTLTATNNNITFVNTLDGAAAGAQSLTINDAGTPSFSAAVGATTPLGALTVTGQNVAFLAPAVLGGNSSFTATGGVVDFAGTVDGTSAGGQSLTASASGAVTFSGALGGTTLLGPINATGQSIQVAMPLVLGGSSGFTATGGGVNFGGTVDGMSAGGQSLTVNASGAITFGGALGGTTPLGPINATGQSILASGPVVLGGDSSFTSTGGTIQFASTIDSSAAGAQSLTISAPSSSVEFDDLIGETNALNNFSITAASLVGGAAPSVEADGAQSYAVTAPITITGNYHTSGFTATGPLVLAGFVNIDADGSAGGSGGSINISGPIDATSPGGQFLTLTASTGSVSVTGAIGGTTPLSSFSVVGANGITLGTLIHTTGAQSYTGPATFSSGDATLTADAGTVTFSSTVNGNGALSIGGTGISLGGDVTTAGNQTYTGPVVLTSDTTLTSSGSTLQFTSTIDGSTPGGQSLAVQVAGGAAGFGGAIGGTTALDNFAVTAASLLGGGLLPAITTTGVQNFQIGSGVTLSGTYTLGGFVDSGPITLLGDTTIIGGTGGIDITGAVNGGHALTLTDSNGLVVLTGSAGSGTALSSLSVTGTGITLGSPIQTTGAQSYSGPITLQSNTTLNASGVTFNGTVDGASTLVLNASGGAVTAAGAIGGATALSSFTVTADTIGLGPVTTTGAQSYSGALSTSGTYSASGFTETGATTLTGDTTISVGAGSVSFRGTVDGAHALQATAADFTVMGGVGGTQALASTNVTANTIRLGSVATTGAQSYGGGTTTLVNGTYQASGFTIGNAAVVQNNVTISTTGGGITFNGTLDDFNARAGSLTLNAGAGDVAFNGLVGNNVRLGAVTINSAHNVTGPALLQSELDNDFDEFDANSFAAGGPSSPITGNFTMPGGISTNAATNQTVSTTSGTVFINALGDVSIGTLDPANPNNDLGVHTHGADVASTATNNPALVAGNGGLINITGASITLAIANVRGGETESGSTVNVPGGNGGQIILTATNGNINLPSNLLDGGVLADGGLSPLATGGHGGNGGSITLNAPNGFVVAGNVNANGGDTVSGPGGNGGTILIDAQTIALGRARARGGDTASTGTAAGAAAGGAITLIATGTAPDVITLTGNSSDLSNSSTAVVYNTLTTSGGSAGVRDPLNTDVGGSLSGAGGTLIIEGSASGAPLNGAILLTSGGAFAPGSTVAGGPNILISGGGLGQGGTVTILGSIVAADPGLENLRLSSSNGQLTVSGSIGTASDPLGLISLTGNNGEISVGGSVVTDTVVEHRSTGSFSVGGTLTTSSFTTPINNSVSLDLSSLFGTSGSTSLAGAYQLVSGGNFSADALILIGTTVISVPNGATPLVIGSIDGAFGLTLNAGADSVSLGSVGTHTALTSLAITAGSIGLGPVVTTGAQNYTGALSTSGTYSATGFTVSGPMTLAGATTINSGTGDLTFGSTVNGAFGLSLVLSGGNVFFDGTVGSTTARLPSLSIAGATNATVENDSSLLVDRFTASNIAGTIDFGNHSLESDDIVAIQATTVEGRIITTADATVTAGTVSGTIQGSAVTVSASGAVNAAVTADSANISGSSFAGSVQATRSANISATSDISANVTVTSGGASLSAANVGGSITSAGLAQIAASQTVAENVTAGGIGITGTAAITGNYTSTGAPISIVGASVDGNVTGLNGGSVAITASQFIVGNIAGGDVSLTSPFIEVNITATTAEINSNFALVTGTIGGIEAQAARFPTDVTQVVDGSTREVANNGQFESGNTNSDEEGGSDEDDNRRRRRTGDPVYDFANDYIDNLMSGKTAH